MIGFVISTAFGATLRFISEKNLNHRSNFYLGTLLVNVVGSFILGVAVALKWPTEVAAFCGAFTTFGGFISQGAIDQNRIRGISYVATTALLSIAAAYVAYQLFS